MDTNTVISTAIGGLVSLIITHLYYRISGKELQKLVGELSAQLARLDEINSNIERRQRLQLERDSQASRGELAQIVSTAGDFGLRTSESIAASLTVVTPQNPNEPSDH